MPKDRTSDARIIAAVKRYLWLPSRERSEALKRDKYTCRECGAKRKEQPLEVHHIKPTQWSKVVRVIRREVLQPVSHLKTLCRDCHKNVKG